MDELDELAEFLRRYIEAFPADPETRGMWLLVLDLEVERIRLGRWAEVDPTLH